MILPLHEQVRARVRDALAQLHGITDPDLTIPIEYPPNRTLGDLGTPIAFDLARRLRKAPRAIAQELAGALGPMPGRCPRRRGAERLPQRFPRSAGVSAVAARPGRQPAGAARAPGKDHRRTHGDQPEQGGAHRPPSQLRARRHARARPEVPRQPGRSPELHRRHRRAGRRRRRRLSAARAPRLSRTPGASPRRRDSITTAGTSMRASPNGTTGDKERLKIRAATLHDIEHGVDPTASLAAFIADTVVRAHLKTMARLNIDYQLLTWEGDILRLKFWARAFEVLKQTGAVYLQNEGKHAGCWVMKIDDPDVGARRRGRRRRSRSARESHRAFERHRRLRRQGHGLPVLEVRTARPRLPVPQVRNAHGRQHAVGDDERRVARGRRSSAVRRRRRHLQRDRRAAVVSAEAAQAGADRDRPSAGSRSPHPLLVRDGGAVARDREGTGLCARSEFGRSEETVRRGVGPQGPRREGRRPDRSRDRQGARRSRSPPERAARRRTAHDRGTDRHRRRPLLPDQVFAHHGDRVRHRRGR